MQDNLILCGFMGCGKSEIAKALAERTGLTLVDMDTYIEQKLDLSIPEIFARFGEAHFRLLECEAAAELGQKSGQIISSGGGAVVYEPTRQALKACGKVIFLHVPLEVLQQRLKNDTGRPLLQVDDRAERIRSLYQERLPIYRQAADFIVHAVGTPQQICDEICGLMQLSETSADGEKQRQPK